MTLVLKNIIVLVTIKGEVSERVSSSVRGRGYVCSVVAGLKGQRSDRFPQSLRSFCSSQMRSCGKALSPRFRNGHGFHN